MLSASVPTLLAVLGTVLMAIVIFAPTPVRATVTASCAPPLAVPPDYADWDTVRVPVRERDDDHGAAAIVWDMETAEPAETAEPPERIPSWPALFDTRAAHCDAGARAVLAGALAEVRAPWAAAILRFALDDEADEVVRDAIAAALRS